MDIPSVLRAYQLYQAIFVYKPVEQDASFSFYVETHPVENKDGVPLLLEGKPLSINTINELVKVFADKKINEKLIPLELIPQELLYFSPQRECVIWHIPAEKRCLFFSKNLNIPSGEYFCPALLFSANGMKSLKVFALKSNNRPSLKSKVYIAPFFNIYEDGKVCTGNVKIPKQTPDVPSVIRFWEKAFFNSEFSESIGFRRVVKSGNLAILWRKMMREQSRFPKNELLLHPRFKTLDDLFDSLGLRGRL